MIKFISVIFSFTAINLFCANAALYSIEDLEQLQISKNYTEFLNHAHDIRPSNRDKRWREMGVSEEHARQCIPHGHFQCAQISANLRTWLHLLDMRQKADAQFEVRQLMDGIELELQRWVPEIYDWYRNNRAKKAQLAP